MAKESTKKSSIERALDVLNCFSARKDASSLEELSFETKIPKTTVFRMLTQLENYGYIKKETIEGKLYYSLGYAFLEKGQLVKDKIDIGDLAKSEMIKLRNDINLTVQLSIRDGMDALYIEQVESWRPIRLYPSVGKKAPLYAAACPRVLLAHTEQEEQDDLLERFDFNAFTKQTPENSEEIKELLQKIKEKGYSVSKGELFEGTLAIAVPVLDPFSNGVLAALSIAGVESDFEEDVTVYVNSLKETSKKISEKLKRNH